MAIYPPNIMAANSNDEVKTLDLMIYYVELGVDFTKTYGDIYESFYSSMASMYGNVLKKINGNDGLLRLYKSRLENIVFNTRVISESLRITPHSRVAATPFGRLRQ
jgi:hypothetical protein